MTLEDLLVEHGRAMRVLFFDIDGTLVSFKTHKIPASTKQAIHEVRRCGGKVFIATGRPIPFINNLEDLEYDGIMSVNGACCMLADGTIISEKKVPTEDIERLIADSKQQPMPIVFADKNRAIGTNLDSGRDKVEEVMKLLNLSVPEEYPIEEVRKMNAMQVIAFFPIDDEPRIMNELMSGCESARWHPAFTDCIAKGTNKASGIDVICQYLGVDVAETMAFGDGGNDITMLRHAGIGIAMGNANDEVKAAADFVTDTVDDDGIAKVLNVLTEN